METVIAEWCGRRYAARVDMYGGALIVGGPIEGFENEREKVMENEKQNEQQLEVPETVSVTVSRVVETLLERQTANEKRIADLEDLTRHLAGGLHLCKEALLGQQAVLEAKDGYVAPDPAKAASN